MDGILQAKWAIFKEFFGFFYKFNAEFSGSF